LTPSPTEDLSPVSGANEADPHLRDSLGLYLLGALAGDEREAVERHLACCVPCCAEASELGAVVDALALLSKDDVQELLVESATARSDGPEPDQRGMSTRLPEELGLDQ
jgi:anti-sigma factor RsiW